MPCGYFPTSFWLTHRPIIIIYASLISLSKGQPDIPICLWHSWSAKAVHPHPLTQVLKTLFCPGYLRGGRCLVLFLFSSSSFQATDDISCAFQQGKADLKKKKKNYRYYIMSLTPRKTKSQSVPSLHSHKFPFLWKEVRLNSLICHSFLPR